MSCVSQSVNYVKAGRDFERKLEQVKTLSCPLIRDQRWFGTAHTLSLMLADVRKSLPVLIPYLQIGSQDQDLHTYIHTGARRAYIEEP